ncbi:MAG: S41 family peptidase [Fimbriimonadaceae bacterium]|nr:S41 family peptidase [Fimbriimonadaceae bacterium]
MAESRVSNWRTFGRQQAFVLSAFLCFGLMTFLFGLQLGRRGGSAEVGTAPTDAVSTALLQSLTQPAARQGQFEPDPLESFMEVYEHLRSKYVEPVGDSDKQKLAYGAIKGMLRELGDPYTRFMEPKDFSSFQSDNEGHFKGIGAMLGIDQDSYKIQVIRVFPNNPAAKAGLKAGDYVIAINGESTSDMSLDVAVDKIRGEAGTTVKLTVERPEGGAQKIDPELIKRLRRDPEAPRTDPAPVIGKTKEISITRSDIDVPVVESELLATDVGYIALGAFNEKSYQQLRSGLSELKAKGAKGFVLDLRNNPGGLLNVAIDVTSLFVKDGAVVHVQEREGAPETLNVKPAENVADLQLPLVVLVNHFSASASEIVSGALQDHKRAQVIGETTYGKGLVQTVVGLSDNSAVAITTAKYLTPNKRDINKKGIEPDVVVPLDLDDKALVEGLTSGKPRDAWDPQVKRAIELLRPKLG